MSDYLVKALGFNDCVRIYAVNSTDTLNTVGKRLNYYPSALAAVGRVISATVMMGAMLKLEETITVKVDGNGPIGLIMADSDAHGHVRAYCENPHCHFEYVENNKLNVRATVGDSGFINVIKDLKLKEPFIGSIPIINGELGEDFAYYFSVSEQVPSAVSLGVLVNEENVAVSAGGFIVQLLPNTPDLVIDLLEARIRELPPISQMLADGMTPTDIVKEIAGDDVKILENVPVNFECKCSRDRFERGLISLGREELTDIIEKDGHAHTVCHFCGNSYDFSKEELESLIEKSK